MAPSTYRISARIDADTYELVKEAAELRGQSVSAFVVDVVRQKALRVTAGLDNVSLVAATEAAFAAAVHLTAADEGAKAALLVLARKIDAWDQIVEWALEDAASSESRPAVPSNDNASIGAYLKGCEQLGLTPSGRATLSRARPAVPEERKPAKLARVTAMRSGSAKK